MQDKSVKFSEFSERTELLAVRTGRNLSDLPQKIGVSPAMFYAYRSGKYAISAKAWRKLEAAERAAGIGNPAIPALEIPEFAESERDVDISGASEEKNSREITDLTATVAELRDQVKLLSHALAALLPPKAPPGEGAGAAKKAGEAAQGPVASHFLTSNKRKRAGSREQGAGSREQGAGSREQGAGSREQGAGSREPQSQSARPKARQQPRCAGKWLIDKSECGGEYR